MNKKIYTLLAILIFASLALAACGETPADEVLPTIIEESNTPLPTPIDAEYQAYIDCVNDGLNDGKDAQSTHQGCGHPEWWPENVQSTCQPSTATNLDLSMVPNQPNGEKVVGVGLVAPSLISITWANGVTDNLIVDQKNTVWINNAVAVKYAEFPTCDVTGVQVYAANAGIAITPIENFDPNILMVVPDVIVPMPLDESTG